VEAGCTSNVVPSEKARSGWKCPEWMVAQAAFYPRSALRPVGSYFCEPRFELPGQFIVVTEIVLLTAMSLKTSMYSALVSSCFGVQNWAGYWEICI
jgi:hypothetical protein